MTTYIVSKVSSFLNPECDRFGVTILEIYCDIAIVCRLNRLKNIYPNVEELKIINVKAKYLKNIHIDGCNINFINCNIRNLENITITNSDFIDIVHSEFFDFCDINIENVKHSQISYCKINRFTKCKFSNIDSLAFENNRFPVVLNNTFEYIKNFNIDNIRIGYSKNIQIKSINFCHFNNCNCDEEPINLKFAEVDQITFINGQINNKKSLENINFGDVKKVKLYMNENIILDNCLFNKLSNKCNVNLIIVNCQIDQLKCVDIPYFSLQGKSNINVLQFKKCDNFYIINKSQNIDENLYIGDIICQGIREANINILQSSNNYMDFMIVRTVAYCTPDIKLYVNDNLLEIPQKVVTKSARY